MNTSIFVTVCRAFTDTGNPLIIENGFFAEKGEKYQSPGRKASM